MAHISLQSPVQQTRPVGSEIVPNKYSTYGSIRSERVLVFRPLFVYKEQEIKKKKIQDERNKKKQQQQNNQVYNQG